MSEHYYTSVPTSESHIREIRSTYRGQEIVFLTDNGVFSKDEVDAGSRILLNALPEKMSGTLLDVGCGWGAMGVSIGRRYPEVRVTMSDVNERALELCRRNAEKNCVTAKILLSDGLENIPGSFDMIITNPPIRAGKQVIYRIFAEASAHLNEKGSLYIVIRKQQGAPSAIKYLNTLFKNTEIIDRSGGYWILKCEGTIPTNK